MEKSKKTFFSPEHDKKWTTKTAITINCVAGKFRLTPFLLLWELQQTKSKKTTTALFVPQDVLCLPQTLNRTRTIKHACRSYDEGWRCILKVTFQILITDVGLHPSVHTWGIPESHLHVCFHTMLGSVWPVCWCPTKSCVNVSEAVTHFCAEGFDCGVTVSRENEVSANRYVSGKIAHTYTHVYNKHPREEKEGE